MSKNMFIILAISVCAGCVGDPFIEEAIAKLDRIPRVCKLPDTSLVVESFAKEKLLGEWSSGVVEERCRHIDGDGVYNSGVRIKNEQYGFFADGSFYNVLGETIIEKGRYGNLLTSGDYLLKMRGVWAYDKGVLTLNTQYYELDINSGVLSAGAKSHKAEKCNKIKMLNVTCYDNGEIAIEARAPDGNESNSEEGVRKTVTIDNQGIKVERTIKVTGKRSEREIGVIDEKIIPPKRFKRQFKNEK